MANHSPVGSKHHIVPISTYLFTWIGLLVLMALTVLASYIQLPGAGNNIVALGIATMKALLVIFIFMGVKYSTKLIKVWAMIGFIWVTFLSGILIDYGTRVPVRGFNGDYDTTIPLTNQAAGVEFPSTDKSPDYDYVAPTKNPRINAQGELPGNP